MIRDAIEKINTTIEQFNRAIFGDINEGRATMKIGDEVYVHGFVDEIRKDAVIIRNDGGYFGTVKSEVLPIQRGKMEAES